MATGEPKSLIETVEKLIPMPLQQPKALPETGDLWWVPDEGVNGASS